MTDPHSTVPTRPCGIAKVVSFDLDGTLIRGTAGDMLEELGLRLADGDAERGARITAGFFREHERLLETAPLAAYDWRSIVAATAHDLGRPAPDDLVELVRERAEAGAARFVNGTTPGLLRLLADDGWRTVVLTNGRSEFQEPILAALGLLDVVDAVITSDRVGAAKPAPEMFRAARGDADCHVHVGDREDHDVAGGNAAGAITILLRPDPVAAAPVAEPVSRPAFTARSFPEVVRILIDEVDPGLRAADTP